MKTSLLSIIVFLLLTPLLISAPFKKQINVTIDPRIELLSAVQFFSGYEDLTGRLTDFDFQYKWALEDYFKEYNGHPVMAHFASMAQSGFSYDAPPTMMLHLSDPPELEIKLPFTDYLKMRGGGDENLNRFVELLRDFAKESDFMQFYNSHLEDYQTMINSVKTHTDSFDYIKSLEDYYGMHMKSYNIVLAPLFHGGGYGPRLIYPDKTTEVYNICGPMGISDGYPTFGDYADFKYLAWHEFSHSFVNPTTDLFIDEINQYAALMEPVNSVMSANAYGEWRTVVNEHLVRAVTTRLSYIYDGKEAGESALNYEKSKGFVYIDPLLEGLIEYENNRDKFPDFITYYPQVISIFKELSEAKLDDDFYTIPFNGPINACFNDKSNTVYIIPTQEKDSVAQASLQDYVKQVRDKFIPQAEIITDQEAVNKDLYDKNIIVYGTVSGNLFLKSIIDNLPVEISSSEIMTNEIYDGKNLRFVTCWRNPANLNKSLLIYTAQQTGDIIGINSVFHGPTDYLIAKGTQVIKSANYNKHDDKWWF